MPKYAVLVSAGPERIGSALNGFEYALSLADDGHDVAIYLDGPATTLPEELDTMADHPLRRRLDESIEREVLTGACAFCAEAYDGTTGCRDRELDLLGTAGEEHGPDVATLVDDGFELVTIT